MSDEYNNIKNETAKPIQHRMFDNDHMSSFFDQLDGELEQELRVTTPAESILEGINPEILREREREYRDVEKHWVRKNAWLKTARSILDEKKLVLPNTQGLRYLTLPAYYRLDVSLLLQENLIEVTQVDHENKPTQVSVAAFESDPTKFGRMQGQSPRFSLLGATTIEKALTEPKNAYYYQLRELFPFDVINFDLTTSLTPRHEGPYSSTLQAIETVFELQSARAYGLPWALFLTFRNLPSDWEENALRQLLTNLQDNLDTYPSVLEAFQKRYNFYNVTGLERNDIKRCISQAVAKWLVDRGHHHKFSLSSLSSYYYSRYNTSLPPYDIYKHVLIFSKRGLNKANIPIKGLPPQTWMEEDLVKCIDSHKCFDVESNILSTSYRGRGNLFEDLQVEIDQLCRIIE